MRRWTAAFLAAVCAVTLSGCAQLTAVKDQLLESGANYLTGDEAASQLLSSMSWVNFEGMREAVEVGADINQMSPLVIVSGTRNPLCWLLTTGEGIGYDLYGNWTNVDFAEYLLTQGADPNYADTKGRTLLMLCCGADGIGYMGAAPILEQLLAHGANVTLTDHEGKTALDYAVIHGETAYISLLLEHGAVPSEQTLTLAFTAPRQDFFLSIRALEAKKIYDACPSGTDAEGFSPLLLEAMCGDSGAVISGAGSCPKEDLAMLAQMAIAFCDLEAVRAVRDAGFSLTVWKDGETSDDGWNYVQLALVTGQQKTALWLLEETGYTESDALVFSAQQGLADMTAFFLDRGALSGAMPRDSGDFGWEVFDNLLGHSARSAEVLRLLFEAGYPTSELSLADALNQAIVSDNMESIRYLCETAGADVAYLPDGIDSALQTACLHGSIPIVEYLLSRGASLTAENSYLDGTVLKHHTELAEYLLEHGVPADGNMVYSDGSSASPPIFDAIRSGRLELVQLLVEHGADVNGRDDWSDGEYQPVLHCAAQRQSSRILQYLIKCGADVSETDHTGKNAADYACSQTNLDILAKAGCSPTKPE